MEDLRVFGVVARLASFAGAARELGVSAAFVTKRVQILEAQLQTRLLHRTTRRVTVTEEGEKVYQAVHRIIEQLDGLMQSVHPARQSPRGLLRISSSLGFGREHVAPALSQLVERYPQLQIRFEVFDRLVDIAAEGFDIDVRVGDEIAPQWTARRLASNHRVLCASPGYLAERGIPRSPAYLGQHDCLAIRERDHAFGLWRLARQDESRSVKVTGPLSTNHGEVAVGWALDGRGIVLRSIWDVQRHLDEGRLVRVLPEWKQEANIWAVMPAHTSSAPKIRACVDFLAAHFATLDPSA